MLKGISFRGILNFSREFYTECLQGKFSSDSDFLDLCPYLTPSNLERLEEHSAGATTWYADTPKPVCFKLIVLILHPIFSRILTDS